MVEHCCTPETRRDKRRRAMLDAAYVLFQEKGYGATTLGDVVTRAGGSLATLYDLFGGKPGLLRAVVAERCASIAEIINNVPVAGAPPSEALRRIAQHLLQKLSEPASIALLRVVITETPRQPDLGSLFYTAGPLAGRRLMADYLATQTANGALSVDNPEAAAACFFDMVLGDEQMRLLCGLPISTHGKCHDSHIDYVVSTFMKIYSRTEGDIITVRSAAFR